MINYIDDVDGRCGIIAICKWYRLSLFHSINRLKKRGHLNTRNLFDAWKHTECDFGKLIVQNLPVYKLYTNEGLASNKLMNDVYLISMA